MCHTVLYARRTYLVGRRTGNFLASRGLATVKGTTKTVDVSKIARKAHANLLGASLLLRICQFPIIISYRVQTLTEQSGKLEISNGLPRSGSGVADAMMADTTVAAVASAGRVVGTPDAVSMAVE